MISFKKIGRALCLAAVQLAGLSGMLVATPSAANDTAWKAYPYVQLETDIVTARSSTDDEDQLTTSHLELKFALLYAVMLNLFQHPWATVFQCLMGHHVTDFTRFYSTSRDRRWMLKQVQHDGSLRYELQFQVTSA